MKSPVRAPLFLVAAVGLSLALALLLPGHPAAQAAAAASPSAVDALPVTVILVRHAETDGSTRSGGDPGLSEAGTRRAERLRELLRSAGVTHLFASTLERTKATLAPLAELAELDIRAFDPRAPDEQLAALRALAPGSVAVVAGHSNTVPALAAALGATLDELVDDPRHGALLAHEDYDRIFVLILPHAAPAGRTTALELRY